METEQLPQIPGLVATAHAAESGESATFEAAFRRFQRPLLAFFARRTGDGGAAENLSQETFLKVFRYWHTYDRSRQFSSWLFTIATNLYRDWVQAQPAPSLAVRETDGVAREETEPHAVAEARDAQGAVRRAVLTLPEKYRTVLLMKHYRNLRYREMALELGINEGTVKSRLNTAAGLLREKLEREGWLR
jgi:RNA polymerase sigma-70 factor (ECF subfamily)